MKIQFKHAALITSFICGVLFCAWMFLPSLLLHLWGVDYSDAVGLMARRNAALFAGLCLIMFLTREATVSVARAGLSAGVALSCLILAVLGILEFENGRAGIGIATAVVTEIALAALFFCLWLADRVLLRQARITSTSI
jgi:glucose dehydrogenase